MIHADGNFKLQRPNHFGKDRFDATAEGKSLLRIRLRQEQSELISSDAEGRVGSTQRFFERCGCGAQDFISARVAVLIVYFLEAMQIQDDQAERLGVAPSAIQFFFEGFSEKPAIVKTREWIGDGIQFEFLEIFMLDNDGHAEEARGCEHIQQCSFESNLPACLVRHRAAARERFVPYLDALRLAQLDVTDRAQEALKKLSACRQVKALERVRKQLEIRSLDRQTRGRKGAGAGHIWNKPNLCLS